MNTFIAGLTIATLLLIPIGLLLGRHLYGIALRTAKAGCSRPTRGDDDDHRIVRHLTTGAYRTSRGDE